MKSLAILRELQNGVEVIHLDGILNADTSVHLEELLFDIAEIPCPKILIDMQKLTYISSAGIGSFFGVIKKVRSNEGDIRFCQLDQKIERVFQLLDMMEFFKFFRTTNEGVSSFQS